MNVLVVFHSLYGHIFEMAKAVAEGASSTSAVKLMQVPETLSPEALEKMGASEAKKKMALIPIATKEDLVWADAIIFGTPTRFGMMTAQMRSFLDRTGGLWSKGALDRKLGSVFTSSGTQHGGQESTILSFHTTLLHHGVIIVGCDYPDEKQSTMDEITGGSPYGASTIASPDGSRMPSENELEIARAQGKRVAEIAQKLAE
jgi:NAD(P)H dehydrogenase (quinone)